MGKAFSIVMAIDHLYPPILFLFTSIPVRAYSIKGSGIPL